MTRASGHVTSGVLLAGTLGVAGCSPAEEAPEAIPEATAPAAVPATDGFLDPNAAARDVLLSAPGVDEALADALVAGPAIRGHDAGRRRGRGSAERRAEGRVVRTRLMPLDLNSASEEEILLIPGVGDRIANEFEEYRPYDAIERFGREIGKYVDEVEVARLERYVTIR